MGKILEKYIGFVLVLFWDRFNNVRHHQFNFIKGEILPINYPINRKPKGFIGSFFFFLGFICLSILPYSGALYFGMLIPMTDQSGFKFTIAFSFRNWLPAILFLFLLHFSIQN